MRLFFLGIFILIINENILVKSKVILAINEDIVISNWVLTGASINNNCIFGEYN